MARRRTPGTTGPVGNPSGLQGPVGPQDFPQIFMAWRRLNLSVTVRLRQQSQRSKRLAIARLRGRGK